MSSFKDMVAQDNLTVFLNVGEYAEERTVIYDGETYTDIPIVITGLKEQDRSQTVSDHGQGLYLVTSVAHCAISDLGGHQPEKGQRIKISSRKNGAFFNEFYVAASDCELGMLRIELEAIGE